MPISQSPHRHPARLLVPVIALTAVLGARGQQVTAEPETDVHQDVGVESPSAREDRLLHLLCRYLKLTRSQVLNLSPFARQTSRGRDLLERECAERRKVFEPLIATQPETAERLRLAMEQRREAVLKDLTATGTRALIRILSREQIALVWRLSRRDPPKYAQADPELVDPSAGFSSPVTEVQLGVGFELDPRSALYAALTDGLAVQGGPLSREAPPESGLRGGTSIAPGTIIRRSFLNPSDDARPFPQLVAETNDPGDLMPYLEPLAGRVFFSDRWLPVLEEVLRSGRSYGVRRPASPGPLRLLRDFRLERGFRDLTGHGEELEPLGGEIQNGQYLFGAGQGVLVPDTGVTDHYAIQLNLVYRGGESYQKILDFKHRTVDGGLYFYQGHLTFYTLANGGSPVAGQEHRLRLERDRSTRIVKAYFDLRPIFAFIDLDDDAVFDKGAAALFVDDQSTKNEQGPGGLRSVNVWGPASTR